MMSNPPNTMLDAMKAIVNPSVTLSVTIKNQLFVKESDPTSNIKKLCIDDVPQNAFALSLDHQSGQHKHCFIQLSCYTNRSTKIINKGCDLILFVPIKPDHEDIESDDKNLAWQILVCDIKSNKPKLKDTKDQLCNSELYVRYLLSMAKEHYGIAIEDVVFRWSIVKTNTRNSRRPTTSPHKRNQTNPLPYHETVVHVGRRKEARVHLGALLK